MPQPRKFRSNAERQEAYRLRMQGHPIHSSADLERHHAAPSATAEITSRVLAADAALARAEA